MSKARELVAAEINGSLDTVANISKGLQSKITQAPLITSLLDAIIEAGQEPSYISWYPRELTCWFKDAESFKAFEAVFAALEPWGYAVDKWTSRRADLQVVYDNPGSEDFSIQLRVDPSENLCKRVQVGTETKEVPVFELRCTEQEQEAA